MTTLPWLLAALMVGMTLGAAAVWPAFCSVAQSRDMWKRRAGQWWQFWQKAHAERDAARAEAAELRAQLAAFKRVRGSRGRFVGRAEAGEGVGRCPPAAENTGRASGGAEKPVSGGVERIA